MSKFIKYLKSSHFKMKLLPEIIRFSAVSIFTFIYGIGVSWFLMSVTGNLEMPGVRIYTGGIPGIAQLLSDVFDKASGGKIILGDVFSGIFIFLANVPILLLGWFKVSKRFTIYSLVSVTLQSTVIAIIPTPDLGFKTLDPLLLAVIGGLLVGIGTGGALKFGTSTGGLDIIAQYVSLRNGKSVGIVSMFMNVGIAVAGGLIIGGNVGIATMAYTVIRILISTVATDKIHTSYQFISAEIITSGPEEMIQEILEKIHRGVTILRAEGAYSHAEKKMLYIVISSYEMNALASIVRQTDPGAFMVTKPVRNVFGNFKRKTIA
ncbi:YitT family protein [Acholeplasma sp. OttesenSCG-928-E16]|nr:YitT family protein [Acholeplasma sp. OttesenSCG-928-E16]